MNLVSWWIAAGALAAWLFLPALVGWIVSRWRARRWRNRAGRRLQGVAVYCDDCNRWHAPAIESCAGSWRANPPVW